MDKMQNRIPVPGNTIEIHNLPEDAARARHNRDMEIQEGVDFDYQGYEVVRGEFFSHLYEPCLTFNNSKIYVNTACIRKLPEIDYIQIMVNPDEKKLAVRPCKEEDKDSFRWCSAGKKRSPKQISCKIFYGKIIELMGWNPDYRYRLVGKLIRSEGEMLFAFDLQSPEIFARTVKKDGKPKSSRIPVYPAEWAGQFGIPAEEHQRTLQVSIFDDYAVFHMQESRRNISASIKEEAHYSLEPAALPVSQY